MKRKFALTAIGAALALTLSSPLLARQVASVQEGREAIARAVASVVNDPDFDAALRDDLARNKASLADVIRLYGERKPGSGAVADELRDLERQVIQLRGLDGSLDALVDLRVHGVSDLKTLSSIRDFWTATVTRDAGGSKLVLAYDPEGHEHRFALDDVPDVPMLIVESDSAAAVRAGTAVINEAFRTHGLQPAPRFSRFSSAGPLNRTSTEELTVLKSIYLFNDQEPNIQGDAEVYAIVSGVDHEGKPLLVTKDMPWLDHDKRWYKPQMDLINWTSHGTNYANVQFFESDGNTNFKDLAVAVTKAVGDLSLIVAPEAPPAAIVAGVAKVGEHILSAMDSKWFENADDYIESFYVIERGGNYGTDGNPLVGARASDGTKTKGALMVLAPYEVRGR